MEEVAKTTIEEGIKVSNGILSRLFGPLADTLGLRMAASAQERLLYNQLEALKRLQAKCKAENINIRQVNLKAIYPYLEGIALEEEPVLQEMWDNLMANYLDADKNMLHIVYPSILKQLSSDDVELLQLCYENGSITTYDPVTEALNNFIPSEGMLYGKDISNLERIRLIEQDLSHLKKTNGVIDLMTETMGMKTYVTSDFGIGFFKACQRDEK